MNDPLALLHALKRTVEPTGNLIAIPPMRNAPAMHFMNTAPTGVDEFYALLLKANGEGILMRPGFARIRNRWVRTSYGLQRGATLSHLNHNGLKNQYVMD
ncbi:MAG: hypothetical protein H7839_01695 [Magnetococcus sp. YQC-5]